ncbi:DNA-binding response regulator [Microbispora sp. RL4-1S]|uniref:DNA-binding response regulator n=1 Tax=Microbispora oryzae TaxID=2806554 RepID=A0A940WHU4_9ACTN|nr:DNA-binding response regulator [Microbispora oryzae]MBP2703008.1 DNA-binding response regulator [Microbispora oryzae]
MSAAQVITLRGDAELLARAGHLFEGTRHEFVCAARDVNTWSQPEVRRAIGERLRVTAELTVKKLLSPAALKDEGTRLHLREAVGRGAEVRISSTGLPHETIMIDRRVMILAGAETATPRTFTVTTEPALVGGVYALFEAAWESATGYTAYLRGDVPHLDADALAVLRALGAGHTDATAARRLGLSLRTYRRRVAELLDTLDAGSRFQAGLRAGEFGLNA